MCQSCPHRCHRAPRQPSEAGRHRPTACWWPQPRLAWAGSQAGFFFVSQKDLAVPQTLPLLCKGRCWRAAPGTPPPGLPHRCTHGASHPGPGLSPGLAASAGGCSHVGPDTRTSFVSWLWEVLRPLWCERRTRRHGREPVFPPRNAGESQKGRALRSRSHYKYTRYTGTRGP